MAQYQLGNTEAAIRSAAIDTLFMASGPVLKLGGTALRASSTAVRAESFAVRSSLMNAERASLRLVPAAEKLPVQLEFDFVKSLPKKPAIQWPPNRGFDGAPGRASLLPGTRVDRFGYDGGTFVSPQGTSYGARAPAPGTQNKPYSVFEVAKPFEVDAGPAAPWFGEVGHGMQYELPASVEDLLKSGHLIRR